VRLLFRHAGIVSAGSERLLGLTYWSRSTIAGSCRIATAAGK
jgi:hypothetical protein